VPMRRSSSRSQEIEPGERYALNSPQRAGRAGGRLTLSGFLGEDVTDPAYGALPVRGELWELRRP
jgi:hypothetical protein